MVDALHRKMSLGKRRYFRENYVNKQVHGVFSFATYSTSDSFLLRISFDHDIDGHGNELCNQSNYVLSCSTDKCVLVKLACYFEQLLPKGMRGWNLGEEIWFIFPLILLSITVHQPAKLNRKFRGSRFRFNFLCFLTFIP